MNITKDLNYVISMLDEGNREKLLLMALDYLKDQDKDDKDFYKITYIHYEE